MDDSEANGSISYWIEAIKRGDPEGATLLWEHYYARLVAMMRSRMSMRGGSRINDEEDAALSAFDSFFHGMAEGRFPEIADRDQLWRLLVVITARKANTHATHEERQKRGGGKVVSGTDSVHNLFARVVSSEPTADFVVMAAEEYQRLLHLLDDDELRRVAVARMEGYTNDEIAEQLGCARRTVARRLDIIRHTWEHDGD